MRRTGESGYTLVELMVVLLIFSVVTGLIAASFNRIVVGSGQILKSAETEIGGLIGLELMRVDLGFAGFGLPMQFPANFSYNEANSHLVDGLSGTDAASFNDAPGNPPRAFVTANNCGFNGSDYLVLKGSSLGMNKTARAWSYLNYSSKGSPASTDLVTGDRVMVVNSVVRGGAQGRDLVTEGSTFTIGYDLREKLPTAFQPKNREDRYLIYGLAPKATGSDDKITFPFNRADYYVGPPSDPAKFSKSCAPGTGLLYRGSVNQNGSFTPVPVLDCVADLQVVFLLEDGNATDQLVNTGDGAPFTAEQIREQLQEVRVYILAQQGKKEDSYSYPDREILVGEKRYSSYGSTWDSGKLAATFGADWMHYRWKVYTIVVQPKNLD